MLGVEGYNKAVERGVVEVAPLAYMRGRTLDNAFVILDEAQNTTSEQMKMFLTRLGFGSKMVITGDVTQVDLPPGKRSGLDEARQILAGVPGISINVLSERDVVRHELVKRIIEAYDKLAPGAGRADAGEQPIFQDAFGGEAPADAAASSDDPIQDADERSSWPPVQAV